MARKNGSNAEYSFTNVALMAAVRTPLTYRVPAPLEVRPGQRLLVPLGTRRVTGIALEPVSRPAPGLNVRDVVKVLDDEPLVSPELLTLGLWIASYYLAPPGEVFRAMLPLGALTRHARTLHLTDAGKARLDQLSSSLLEGARRSDEAALLSYLAAHPGVRIETVQQKFRIPGLLQGLLDQGLIQLIRVEEERRHRQTLAVRLSGPLPERACRLSPLAQRILRALEETGGVNDHRDLLRSTRATLAHLKNLSHAGLIELSESRAPRAQAEFPLHGRPLLTSAQKVVLDDLVAHLERRRFAVALLHGVTASGKTEIYLQLIAHCLERGQTAIVLVPEIALTPAVQSQFLARFGDRVAVLHSGLRETERREAWWRVHRGQARVVVGTRSAVFAPVANLGVVIVDEEHDPSYKQQECPRYHARDVAVVRARLASCLALLGSATPSLESYWNAEQGKYRLCRLEERIGGRPLASVEIVDMRQEFRETHTQVPFSRRLRAEIEARLRAREQVMILLNRRGYAWFVLCRTCGETQRCVNCSIPLTYHRRQQRLLCHYCGYAATIPSHCPACGSEFLYYIGEGTEKLEAKVAETFPGARVGRLDRDVAQRAADYHKLLAEFRQGSIDILVGTQLIAKGHDFPGVTLVGVVSADTGLALPDFRAAERTFQLLTQAAGRAGRGEIPGQVLVQTFYPEHYAIRLAAAQDYAGFYGKEIRFRRMMRYPPVTSLAQVIVEDRRLTKAAQLAQQVATILSRAASGVGDLKILGPSPAPRAKLEGRYRIQLLIKARSRSRLNFLLHRMLDECGRHGISSRSLVVDVDPLDIM